MILFAIFAQAIIFQIYGQIAKRLQERGFSSLDILYYARLAVYPSAVALLFLWNQASFLYLVTHPHLTLVFLGFITAASLFDYLYFISRNMTRSLSFVSAVLNAIGLPLLLLGGLLINHDIPKLYELVGISLLACAVFLKPSAGAKVEKGKQLLYSIPLTFLIAILYLILQSTKDPLYRDFLTHMPNVWFAVALYLFCSTLLFNIFFLFKKLPVAEESKENEFSKKLAYAIPALLFIGSFPEAYGFSKVPVYTLVAITMSTFLMSLASDLYNKRIRWDVQTVVFATLVITGVGLSIIGRL